MKQKVIDMTIEFKLLFTWAFVFVVIAGYGLFEIFKLEINIRYYLLNTWLIITLLGAFIYMWGWL